MDKRLACFPAEKHLIKTGSFAGFLENIQSVFTRTEEASADLVRRGMEAFVDLARVAYCFCKNQVPGHRGYVRVLFLSDQERSGQDHGRWRSGGYLWFSEDPQTGKNFHTGSGILRSGGSMHRKDPDTDAAFLPFPEEAYSAEEDPELFPKASSPF